MAAALVATAIIGHLNKYATHNVFVPSYIGIAILVGVETGWLEQYLSKIAKPQLARLLFSVEWLILIVQFSALLGPYLTAKTIPSNQDLASGNSLLEKIRNYPKDVLLPDQAYLALYAGKQTYFSQIPMAEIAGQESKYPMPEWPALRSQIFALIHSPNISATIVNYYWRGTGMAGCQQERIHYPDKKTFIPVVEAERRPSFIAICQ
jgi:hypothetical protein